MKQCEQLQHRRENNYKKQKKAMSKTNICLGQGSQQKQ